MESNFATFKGKSRFIIDYDDIVGTPINYLSENIGLVACNNKENGDNERQICDIATKYREDGTQDYMEPIDHIGLPEMEGRLRSSPSSRIYIVCSSSTNNRPCRRLYL